MNAIATVSWTNRSDESLAEGYCQGNAPCFDEIVRRYSTPVYSFCRRMAGRPQDAEDLTQEVFVQIYRSLPAARTDLPLRPWIFVIARNKCLDHLKRRRALTFTDVASDDGDLAVIDDAPLPEDMAERDGLRRLIEQAIARLPGRYRAVVALRYSSDLTFAEIGERLGMPENTAKTHFQRAKALLRQQLRGRW